MAAQEMARSLTGALGRMLLAALFLVSALHWVLHFDLAVEVLMVRHAAPHPRLLAAVFLLFELLGAIMVLVGWRARVGASLLVLYALPVGWQFHVRAGSAVPWPYVHWGIGLWPALALTGGLLLVVAHGPGAFSSGRS